MAFRKRLTFLVVMVVLALGGLGLAWRGVSEEIKQASAIEVMPMLPESLRPPVAAMLEAAGVGIEICGYGRYVVAEPSAGFIPPEVMRGSELAMRRLAERLTRSESTRERALGLFLGTRQPTQDSEACAGGQQQCRGRHPLEISTLAELAESSRDAGVYALALEVCKGMAANELPACARLSPSALAERDQGNFAALARTAPGASPEAQRAWLQRLAQADRSDHYTGLVHSLLAEPELREVGEAVRTANLLHMEGVIAAFYIPGYEAVLQACSKAGVDSEVRNACERIAQGMLAKPGDLMELSMGARLGKQLGWDDARIGALNEERSRLFAAIEASGKEMRDGGVFNLGCKAKASLEGRAVARQRMNEVEYARKLLADGALPPLPSALPSPFGRGAPALKAQP